MAQADGVVANGTGSAVRSDINNQYAALWSNHSGSTEPSSGKVAYQFWADTNTSILKIRNSANNAWINLFTLAGGIDVDAASNFNEDVTFTGASANVTWDKSADDLIFADNANAAFGTGSDLKLYHNGSDSYIVNSTGGFHLWGAGDGTTMTIRPKSSENSIVATANGSVDLYFDNVKKLATSAAGVTLSSASLLIPDKDGDNNVLRIGTGEDLLIFHSNNQNTIKSTNGRINFNAAETRMEGADGSELIGRFIENGAVELFFDNSKKLEILSARIDCTAHFNPSSNDDYDLGGTSAGMNRWRTAFTVNALNTSDRNLKNNIIESDLGLSFINKLKPVSYKWNAESLGTKTHYGLIAQDVEEVITNEGKTLNDFGAVDKPDGNDMSLAYNEFLSPLIKAVQELSTEVETLKTKVAALEAK